MLALLTHTYARVIHTNSVFFPSLPSPPSGILSKSSTLSECFPSPATPCLTGGIAKLVKEVKEKNTFCKECARVRARIFAPRFRWPRAALSTKKGFPKFSVRI